MAILRMMRNMMTLDYDDSDYEDSDDSYDDSNDMEVGE